MLTTLTSHMALIICALAIFHPVNIQSNTIMERWVKLDRAYLMHNDAVMRHESGARNTQISLYAKSLLASLNGRFKRATVIGKKCVDYDGSANYEKFMHFVCLLDVSRNYGYMFSMKRHYYYLYTARKYAISEKRALELVSGHKFIKNFLNSSSFLVSNPEAWPITTINVSKNWKSIRMHDGIIDVQVDNKIVPMLIDTGSSGIMVTTSDISKYHLENDLKLINSGGVAHGYNVMYKTSVYVTNTLKFGPVTIDSPYITVINDKRLPKPYFSTIGINVLKHLGSFVYSTNYITRQWHSIDSTCSRMSIRIPVSGYAYGWGIFIPLNISFGIGSYYLDTGVDSAYPRSALSIYSNYANHLVSSGVASIFDAANTRKILSSTNGKRTFTKARFVKFSFVDKSHGNIFLASVLPDNYRISNPYFFGEYGIVGRNTVRESGLSVYLNFKTSDVCISYD